MSGLQEKKDLVRAFFDEVWNKGRFEFIDENYSDEFRLTALWQNTALGGSGEASKEMAKTVISRWREGMPDLNMTVEEQLGEGDFVVCRHVCSGTHENEFMGIPPTGKQAAMSGITITKVTDGKIVQAWTCWDAAALFVQLGMAPGPPGAFDPPAFAATPRPFDEEADRNADPEEAKRVVTEFYAELWTKGNLDAADDYFAEDFVGHAPSNTGAVGPAGVKELVATWRRGVPDMKIEIHAQHAEGSRVGTRFSGSGRHDGEFLGIPATGKDATLSGIAITRVVDGKVVADWGEFDMIGLFQQLGVTPQPA
jgi:steroid delta-isomerase-like uncharacterized protein